MNSWSNYQLSNKKGCYEQKSRSFCERPVPRASDKYQGLADGADLKINSRCQLFFKLNSYGFICHVKVVLIEVRYIETFLQKQKQRKILEIKKKQLIII